MVVVKSSTLSIASGLKGRGLKCVINENEVAYFDQIEVDVNGVAFSMLVPGGEGDVEVYLTDPVRREFISDEFFTFLDKFLATQS